jgi:hypothetical protein
MTAWSTVVSDNGWVSFTKRYSMSGAKGECVEYGFGVYRYLVS